MSKLVSRIEPRSWGVSPSGHDQRERPDVGGRVPAAGDLPAVGAPRPSRRPAGAGATSCFRQVLRARARRPRRGPRPGRRRPGRWACPLRGNRDTAWAGSRSTSRRPVPPSRRRGSCRRTAGRRRGPPCPSGRRGPCGRGRRGSRSACRRRSIGTTPADCAASTRKQAPALADDRGDRLDRLDGPQHVRGVGHGHERGPRASGPAGWLRGRGSRSSEAIRVSVMTPVLLERPQRPADRVVLQVGRDDVVAGLERRP